MANFKIKLKVIENGTITIPKWIGNNLFVNGVSVVGGDNVVIDVLTGQDNILLGDDVTSIKFELISQITAIHIEELPPSLVNLDDSFRLMSNMVTFTLKDSYVFKYVESFTSTFNSSKIHTIPKFYAPSATNFTSTFNSSSIVIVEGIIIGAEISSLDAMFEHSELLEYIGEISMPYGVSPVTTNMFNDCTSLIRPNTSEQSVIEAGGSFCYDYINDMECAEAKNHIPLTLTNKNPGKPTVPGKLGHFFDGGDDDKWIHDGTDWVEWKVASGLEAINDIEGIGWRLIGRDKALYSTIGENAVDISITDGIDTFNTNNFIDFTVGNTSTLPLMTPTTTSFGASGKESFAVGWDVKASGTNSFAAGVMTEASGWGTTAIGYQTSAAGNAAIALGGGDAQALGTQSLAMLNHAKAKGLWSIAIGPQSETTVGQVVAAIGPGTLSPTGEDGNNTVGIGIANTGTSTASVEIGVGNLNGSSYSTPKINRKTGLELYADGSLNAPNSTISIINSRGDKALTTKEYVDTKFDLTTIIDVTYAELKAMHTAATFVPGQAYQITDYRTLWYLSISNNINSSNWGLWVGVPEVVTTYGLTLKIEPLVVIAKTSSELNKEVHSPSNPTHIIEYDPRWAGQGSVDATFPTAVATTEFRGMITYRRDPYLDIASDFDYLSVQNVRWKATAVEWDASTTYSKGNTVKISDASGDGHYIYINEIDSSGNDPSEINSKYWIVFRDKGADTTGTYKDYWLANIKSDGSSDILDFKIDTENFILMYTFALVYDLTNATGGYGNWSAWYYHAKIGRQAGNVLLIKTGEGRSIYLPADAEHNTISGYRFNNISVTTKRFRNTFIFGWSAELNLTASMENNYISGMYEVMTSGPTLSRNIFINPAATNKNTSFKNVTIYGDNNILNVPSTGIQDTRFNVNNVGGKADIKNSTVTNINNCTLFGVFRDVDISNFTGVVFNHKTTFNNVMFNVPHIDKNFILSMPAVDTVYENITVNKAYFGADVTKLWYSEVDKNGLETYKELK